MQFALVSPTLKGGPSQLKREQAQQNQLRQQWLLAILLQGTDGKHLAMEDLPARQRVERLSWDLRPGMELLHPDDSLPITVAGTRCQETNFMRHLMRSRDDTCHLPQALNPPPISGERLGYVEVVIEALFCTELVANAALEPRKFVRSSVPAGPWS